MSEEEVAKTCSSSARPESIDTHSSSVKISSSVSSDSPKTKKRKIPKKDLAGGVASSPKKKMKVSENNVGFVVSSAVFNLDSDNIKKSR